MTQTFMIHQTNNFNQTKPNRLLKIWQIEEPSLSINELLSNSFLLFFLAFLFLTSNLYVLPITKFTSSLIV